MTAPGTGFDWRHELRLFFVAVQFLTRAGVPSWVGFQPDWLNASARYFPLVGFFIGVVAVCVVAVATHFVSLNAAVWLALITTVVFTGAFHEDGLADTFDALGGSASPERALEIMKDSRLGTYGVVALVLTLGLKVSLLSTLPLESLCAAWLLAHTASRAVPVVLIRLLPYVGDPNASKAKPLAQGVSRATQTVALQWVLGVAVLLFLWRMHGWAQVLVGLACAVGMALWCRNWFARRLGGITGDTLGAAQQLTELAVLVGWVLMHNVMRRAW